MDFPTTAANASSSRSNTRAGPLCSIRSCPESFTTQPSGARLPRRIANPPFGLIASDTGRITSCPSVSSALSAISPSVCPVTVMASSWSSPASLSRRITSGTPPAR